MRVGSHSPLGRSFSIGSLLTGGGDIFDMLIFVSHASFPPVMEISFGNSLPLFMTLVALAHALNEGHPQLVRPQDPRLAPGLEFCVQFAQNRQR